MYESAWPHYRWGSIHPYSPDKRLRVPLEPFERGGRP